MHPILENYPTGAHFKILLQENKSIQSKLEGLS